MTYAKWVQYTPPSALKTIVAHPVTGTALNIFESPCMGGVCEQQDILATRQCFGPHPASSSPATLNETVLTVTMRALECCSTHVTEDTQQSLVSMAKDNDAVRTVAGPISTVGTWAAVTTSVGLIQSNLLCAVKALREHHLLP